MKVSRIERARQFGLASAEELFKDLQEVTNRGVNFKWEKLPDMSFKYAYNTVFMIFTDKEFGPAYKAVAADAALARAKELLKQVPVEDLS